MQDKQIVAKQNKDDGAEEFTTSVKWPDNIDEAVELWGEEDVLSLACQQKVVRLQANLRRPADRKTVSTKEVYNKLVTGGMDEKTARDISQYAGD